MLVSVLLVVLDVLELYEVLLVNVVVLLVC